ncbi:MBL fold metallo-hydrolase [Glaciecola sp. 1036]|uniref:MBL fold metallo-hydrolase n=1 Tax=Alteromonadaceae TaxID=72275 RepID=UPI003D088C1F
MQIHQISGFIQNIFLVEYDHGCMLLDGASRADLRHIIRFFKDVLQRPITDLKVVMVTHMHPDHAGCAHKLREVSGCKIVTGDVSKPWYSGISGRFSHLVDISLAYWVANRLNKPFGNLWFSTKLKPDVMLSDGDRIPEFQDWQVITTPGHTDRDISIYNLEHNKIYVADLIVRVKKQLTSPFPVHFPNSYRNSLRKLQDFIGFELMMAHVDNTELSEEVLSQLISNAPETPRTNLNAVKNKIQRINLLRSKT